jgi:hypothetical protein
MFTLKTPCLTTEVSAPGAAIGHRRVPPPTVRLSQIENLKKYAVPDPPRRSPFESASRPW